MYRNWRSSSLLEWKIIADQEAENYLLQSYLNKGERKESKNRKHESNWGQPNRTKTTYTTKATQYVEGNKQDNPEEEISKNMARPRTKDNMGKTTVMAPGRNHKVTEQRSEIHIRKRTHNQETTPGNKR